MTKYFPLLDTVVALTDDWALQIFDDDLGLWLTLAQADEEEEMVRAGIPVLRGPYVIEFSSIASDGDKVTLWTPAVGDVILRIFPDVATITEWDKGNLAVGQNVDIATSRGILALATGEPTSMRQSPYWQLDLLAGFQSGAQTDGASVNVNRTALIIGSTDPIEMQWKDAGSGAASAGHIELYALVARAVAP